MKINNTYTDNQFNNLERYPNGDIINLYEIHIFLSEEQIDKLTEDDWSRVIEYQSELDYMKSLL